MGTADAHCHIVYDTPYIKRETVVVTMTNGSRCHRHQIDLNYTHTHMQIHTHMYTRTPINGKRNSKLRSRPIKRVQFSNWIS